MKKLLRNKAIDVIIKIALCLMIVFFFGYLFIGELTLPSQRIIKKEDCDLLDLDWVWIKDSGDTEHIKVPGNYKVAMGETMKITAKLPNIADNTCLMFFDKGSDVEIFIDGIERYSFSQADGRWLGDANSYTYLFVDVNSSDSNKEISFILKCDTESTGSIGELYIGDKGAEILTAIVPYQLLIITAIILLVVGVFCVVMDIVIFFRNHTITNILYLGIGVALASLWVLMNMQPRQFLFSNTSIIRDCAFLIVPIMIMPFLIYVDAIQRKRNHLAYILNEILIIINFIVLVAKFLITGLIRFDPILYTIGISIIVMLSTVIRDIIQHKIHRYKTIAIGMMSMLISGVAQFIYYILFPYYSYGSLFLVIGSFIFIITAIIDSVHMLFRINDKKEKAEKQVKEISVQAMEALAHVVDAKDKYTSGHSVRVSNYSVMLARKLGWSAEQIHSLRYIALLHDVGKIGIPDSIINKEGKLTEKEYELIKSHTTTGAEILNHINEIEDISVGAHWHHERYDGKGYPDKLSGEDIPFIARIIAVADSYDAMTSNRSYRKLLPQSVVREEIENNIGKQFDPDIAKLMLEIIDEDKEYKLCENNMIKVV